MIDIIVKSCCQHKLENGAVCFLILILFKLVSLLDFGVHSARSRQNPRCSRAQRKCIFPVLKLRQHAPLDTHI